MNKFRYLPGIYGTSPRNFLRREGTIRIAPETLALRLAGVSIHVGAGTTGIDFGRHARAFICEAAEFLRQVFARGRLGDLPTEARVGEQALGYSGPVRERTWHAIMQEHAAIPARPRPARH